MTISVALSGWLSSRFRLDVAFDFPSSGVTAVSGASGAGKTSLLRAVAGLDRLEGHVLVGEECWQNANRFVPVHRRGLGYVFQGSSLLPHLSVRANLDYAARRSPRGRMQLEEISSLADIESLLDRKPDRLSGGEAQRCAIARALIARPNLLLMDEPLAALDSGNADALLGRLKIIFAESGVPVLYVTHDASEAERLATTSILLTSGRIERAAAG